MEGSSQAFYIELLAPFDIIASHQGAKLYASYTIIMERKRVYSLKPHATLCANFSHTYLNYLLPVLRKLAPNQSCDKEKDPEMEKVVRFQVDMALAISAAAGGFGWSRALKHKLESDMNVRSLRKHPSEPPTLTILLKCSDSGNGLFPWEAQGGKHLSPFPSLPLARPLNLTAPRKNPNPSPSSPRNSGKASKVYRERRGKRSRSEFEDLGCRLESLRRILPGGDEMRDSELLSEVESYVVCLQLQINTVDTSMKSVDRGHGYSNKNVRVSCASAKGFGHRLAVYGGYAYDASEFRQHMEVFLSVL